MQLKVYEFKPRANNVFSLQPIDLDHFGEFIGKPMKNGWQPPEIRIMSKTRPLKDFVSLMLKSPVFSEKAKNALESLIGKYVEFLPLIELKNRLYYAVNVIYLADCLDHDKTVFTYVQGKIICIEDIQFIYEKIPDVPIFKVPQDIGTVFVRQPFVDVVIQNQLTGAIFFDPNAKLFEKRDDTALDIPGLIK